MRETIKFTGCKYLDYGDNYGKCTKELISTCGETKICWQRPVIDSTDPSLVQFCSRRGRMNHPEMCLCEENKGCFDYEDFEHELNLDKINT